MRIKNHIAKVRKDKNLSQEKLAGLLGMKRQHPISMIERNLRSDTRLSTAFRFAKALEMKIDDLFYIEE